MLSKSFISDIVGRIGVAPVILAALSFPIISFFSFVVSLSVPTNVVNASNLSSYTFFLFSSIAATFACARIFDFVFTGIVSLLIEIYTIIRGTIKIRLKRPSEAAATLYEIRTIRALDQILQSGNAASKHYVVSFVLSLYFYWAVFLRQDLHVLFLAFVCILFLLATTGSLNRKKYPAFLNVKKEALASLKKSRAFSQDVHARIAEIEEQLKKIPAEEMSPEIASELAFLKDQMIESKELDEEMDSNIRKIRFIAPNFVELPRLIRQRLRLDLQSALENPIGLSAILLCVAIYIGYARAEGMWNAPPGKIQAEGHSFCGRILFISDDGYFLNREPDSRTVLYVAKDQFFSIEYKPTCQGASEAS